MYSSSLYIIIGLTAILVILILLVILQIVWIRTKLSELQDKQLNRYTNNAPSSMETGKGTIGLYSIVLDTKTTLKVNDQARPVYDDLRSILGDADGTFMLPNTCPGGSMKTKSMKSNKIGFLCCKSTPSSHALQEDIVKGKISYIIFNDQMLLIEYNETINDEVVNLNISKNKLVSFVIYAVPVSKDSNDQCSVNLKPFMGGIQLHDNVNIEYIDVRIVLGLQDGSPDLLPTQIVAYKIVQ